MDTVSKILSGVRLEQNGQTTLALQIVDELSNLIETGRLPVGQKLPPTKQLARLLGVSTQVAQDALALLVTQGKLTRKQRVGTLVGKPISQKTIGLLTRTDPRLPLHANFGWLIAQAFSHIAEKRGWMHREYIIRHSDEERRLSGCLIHDIIERRIDLLLAGACGPEVVTRWLKNPPVPIVHVGIVRLAREEAIRDAVKWLTSNGCKRLSLVVTGDPMEVPILIRCFKDVCSRKGLRTRPEWIVTGCWSSDECGRSVYRRLFAAGAAKPDAVIVMYDFIAYGMIRESKLNGDALDCSKVVVQVNKGSVLHLPPECGFMEIDWEEVVEKVFEQIEAGGYSTDGDDPASSVTLRFIPPKRPVISVGGVV